MCGIAWPKVIDEASRNAVLSATSGRSKICRGPGPPAKAVLTTPNMAKSEAKMSASLIR